MRRTALARVSVAREVGVFLLAGLLVLAAVAALLAVLQQRSAVQEAVRDARTLTNLEAHDVVGPALTDAALQPGPAQAELARVVREHVLGALIVRVKIWDAGGRVVWSDDPAIVGRTFTLGRDEQEVLRSGQTVAEVSDLQEEENTEERQFGRLMQVYLGVRTPAGTPLLFETYQPYDAIRSAGHRLWLASLPAVVGGLGLLYLVLAPLAYRMAVRLRASQDEREQLLIASLAVGDRERTRIAADLHDGVVQGLAGSSFRLEAAARAATPPAAARAMVETAADLRRWVRELRSLVVTVTPPALHAQGLRSALVDLVAVLESRGIAVALAVEPLPPLAPEVESLAYRVAQEASRNIVRHARASHVDVAVRHTGAHLELEVRDDGSGFTPGSTTRRTGSVGLELLTRLVEAQGGRLDVVSAPGQGTCVRLRTRTGTARLAESTTTGVA